MTKRKTIALERNTSINPTKEVRLFRQSGGRYGVEGLKLDALVPYGVEDYGMTLPGAWFFYKHLVDHFL